VLKNLLAAKLLSYTVGIIWKFMPYCCLVIDVTMSRVSSIIVRTYHFVFMCGNGDQVLMHSFSVEFDTEKRTY